MAARPTADQIADVVSRVPNAAATIIPFDVQNRLHVLQERQAIREGTRPASLTPVPGPPQDGEQHLEARGGRHPSGGRRLPGRGQARAAAWRLRLRPADPAA